MIFGECSANGLLEPASAIRPISTSAPQPTGTSASIELVSGHTRKNKVGAAVAHQSFELRAVVKPILKRIHLSQDHAL